MPATLSGAARRWWRTATPLSLRQRLNPAVRAALRLRARLAGRQPGFPSPGPLIVSGFLSDARGIGRAGRLTATALTHAGLKLIPHDLGAMFAAATHGANLPGHEPGGVWLLHCNAPEAMHAFERLRPATWRNRYRIGYWAYELPTAPRNWAAAAAFFDEIWTPSQFVAESLQAAGVRSPLRIMPHPVGLEGKGAADRPRFGLPAEAFCVLCVGDFRSSATRKNLRGALEIYCRTFAPGGGARLIVKTLGTPHSIGSNDRPDVIFIHEELSDDGMRSLVASCDLLLSPHRSEGFGLTLAEAFLHGAPALATGWSGNMEFMGDLPELLIPCTLVRVQDEDGVYGQGLGDWAEPDLDAASAKLRALAESPDLRRSLAERGRANVLRLSETWQRTRLAEMPLGRLVRAAGP